MNSYIDEFSKDRNGTNGLAIKKGEVNVDVRVNQVFYVPCEPNFEDF